MFFLKVKSCYPCVSTASMPKNAEIRIFCFENSPFDFCNIVPAMKFPQTPHDRNIPGPCFGFELDVSVDCTIRGHLSSLSNRFCETFEDLNSALPVDTGICDANTHFES